MIVVDDNIEKTDMILIVAMQAKYAIGRLIVFNSFYYSKKKKKLQTNR